MRTLLSGLIWIYWALCIITFFVIITALYLLTVAFDRYRRIPNRALQGLGWMMIKTVPGWQVEFKGIDPSKLEKPTIVVANHQSFLDMPLTYLLPWKMKWVAKKELFKIPILGWIIYMTGHIGIDRASRRSITRLNKLVEPIQKGIPGMIFPEGTRSATGQLEKFKMGAFLLAEQYNFNVLPIVLDGGHQAMPPGSWRINRNVTFTVSVLDPLDPGDFKSADELKMEAFDKVDEELGGIMRKG